MFQRRRGKSPLSHPVPRQHLYQSHPKQDACTKGIQRSNGYDRGWIVAVEMIQHADADGHTDGGDESKRDCHERFVSESRKSQLCDAAAEG